jgi:hypothetical protein
MSSIGTHFHIKQTIGQKDTNIPNKIIVGDFNNPHQTMIGHSDQKINQEISETNYTADQMYLTGI